MLCRLMLKKTYESAPTKLLYFTTLQLRLFYSCVGLACFCLPIIVKATSFTRYIMQINSAIIILKPAEQAYVLFIKVLQAMRMRAFAFSFNAASWSSRTTSSLPWPNNFQVYY